MEIYGNAYKPCVFFKIHAKIGSGMFTVRTFLLYVQKMLSGPSELIEFPDRGPELGSSV